MGRTNAFVDADNSPLVEATHADYVVPDFSLANAVAVEHLEGVPVAPFDDEEPEQGDDHLQNLTVGAGVATGAVGLLVGGPFLAILAGFGTAYATKQAGATGDVARAIGHVALEAKAKAVELDRQHNLVQKGKEAASEAWEKAKEFDRKHNILERSKAFLVWSWDTMVELNRRHRLVERAVNATGALLTFVATKIGKALQTDEQTPSTTTPSTPPLSTPAGRSEK
ncbi:hypothetical protein MHU86_25317 [Fragilaria crotonensis]|nr:hypothetical protein MHU86_25317 [Fragilaria crotonensis]